MKTSDPLSIVSKLTTPQKIQKYLDSIPFNFEKDGETCMSPLRVVEEQKAHCIEGAMLAAYALMLQGKRPLLLNLKVKDSDVDHVVTLYKTHGLWGAMSKTNHAVLRYRDPVYKTVRELAMSYFHEYFLPTTGEKTLVGYSRPISMRRFGDTWIRRKDDMWDIAEYIFDAPYTKIIPKATLPYLAPASAIEIQAATTPEW